MAGLQEDAKVIHAALTKLLRVYQFRDRERICYHGVTVTQCYALGILAERAGLTLNALADELHLEKSTASRMVDGLEGKGLVRREPDREDARRMNLRITRKGQGLQRKIEHELVREEMKIFQEFEPEVRRAAADILSRLAGLARARFARNCLRE